MSRTLSGELTGAAGRIDRGERQTARLDAAIEEQHRKAEEFAERNRLMFVSLNRLIRAMNNASEYGMWLDALPEQSSYEDIAAAAERKLEEIGRMQ